MAPFPNPAYLNFADAITSYYWIASVMAFDYKIDASRLQQAVQSLLQGWPILGARYFWMPRICCARFSCALRVFQRLDVCVCVTQTIKTYKTHTCVH